MYESTLVYVHMLKRCDYRLSVAPAAPASSGSSREERERKKCYRYFEVNAMS